MATLLAKRRWSLATAQTEELFEWRLRDPLVIFQKWLIENKLFTETELSTIEDQVNLDVQESVSFAESSPWPEPEEALQDLFA